VGDIAGMVAGKAGACSIIAAVDALPDDYLRALDLFNRGRYHAAQTLLLKLSEQYPAEYGFFYGLLQFSSGVSVLLKARTGLGSRALFARSAGNLLPFRPWHRGLDVDELLGTLAKLEELCHAIAATLPQDYDPIEQDGPWPGGPDVTRLLPALKLSVELA
jgi:hypothetical protein